MCPKLNGHKPTVLLTMLEDRNSTVTLVLGEMPAINGSPVSSALWLPTSHRQETAKDLPSLCPVLNQCHALISTQGSVLCYDLRAASAA